MIPVLRFYHNAFIGAGISVIILLVTLWIPETPRFLLAKRKEDKALKTLKLLRGPSFDVASELKQIEMALQEKSNLSLKEFIYEMKERNVYLPFILMTFLMLFQQFSGVNAIVFYAGPVFKSIGFQSNPQLISFLAVGLPAVILTIFCALIVDRFGRKPLLILSAAVVSLSFVGLSVSVGLGNINTLSVVSVIVFEIGFSLGYGAIPWIMIAEMIPMSVRGILGGILCAVNWGSAAIVTGSFLYFKEEVGLDNAWRTFAGINILSVIFVAVFLPETKGKNLESIELELKHSYKLCSS
jgi:MFS family permease